mgnify:CR=1 FL=1
MYKNASVSNTYELSLLLINISESDIIYLVYNTHGPIHDRKRHSNGVNVTINESNNLIHPISQATYGSIDNNGIIKLVHKENNYIIPEQIVKKHRVLNTDTKSYEESIRINLKPITSEEKQQIEGSNASK